MNQSGKLKDRKILITGAGRGIGEAISKRFAEEGADTFLVSRTQSELQKVSASIKDKTGNDSYFTTADVEKEADVIRSVEYAIKELGHIDTLVNSAGISISGKSEEFSIEKWSSVINTNLTGTFLFCREVGRHFIHSGIKGNIINITSIVAHAAIPQRIAYASSKGGVRQLTQNLALEWGHYGIRTNAITPGYIDTAQFRRYVELGIHDPDKLISRIPLRRMGTPNDIAGPAIFLASDDSSYVNGATLVVDGGVLINGYV